MILERRIQMEKLIRVRKKNLRRFISALLILAMVITSIGIEQFGTKVYAQGSETKIYFKDKTENGWISHDNAEDR